MERVTFIESIIKILNLIASVPFFIEILLLSIILLIAMIFFYFMKSKKGKIISLIIYIVTLILLPISHFSFFVETVDKIIENYIKIIYFPSCYVYIALLIVTDIGVCKSIIKNIKSKERKWFGIFELLYFCIFQFLFFLIIRTVIAEKIDIFERTELYSNALLTSLLQISSYLFWIRVGVKLICFIVNKLSRDNSNVLIAEDTNKSQITKIGYEVKDISKKTNELVNSNFINNDFPGNGLNDKNGKDVIINFEHKKNIDIRNLSKKTLQDFPVNREFELKNKKALNSDDVKENNTHLSIENLMNANLKESNMSNSKIPNTNLDLNENEETDTFFDDFYE